MVLCGHGLGTWGLKVVLQAYSPRDSLNHAVPHSTTLTDLETRLSSRDSRRLSVLAWMGRAIWRSTSSSFDPGGSYMYLCWIKSHGPNKYKFEPSVEAILADIKQNFTLSHVVAHLQLVVVYLQEPGHMGHLGSMHCPLFNLTLDVAEFVFLSTNRSTS